MRKIITAVMLLAAFISVCINCNMASAVRALVMPDVNQETDSGIMPSRPDKGGKNNDGNSGKEEKKNGEKPEKPFYKPERPDKPFKRPENPGSGNGGKNPGKKWENPDIPYRNRGRDKDENGKKGGNKENGNKNASEGSKPEESWEDTAAPSPRPPKEGRDGKPFPKPPKDGKTPPFASDMKAEANSAYLMDYASGTVLFKQNEKEHYPIASMCKIMSLILIFEDLEKGNFEECAEITVSENASSMGGSQVFLEANGTYKICDLIKSIIVASANDATVAMSELIAGSEENFVGMMNSRAKELGMGDTVFVNCTGLPQPGQFSCAMDVALMTKELLRHEVYFKYSRIWMDKITHKDGRVTEISNTNKLVRFYKGCDGGKTGYTSEAKHCVSATALRGGMRLISVILGAEDSKTRFGEAGKLLNFGFACFVSKQLVYKDKPCQIRLRVRGGKSKNVEIVPSEDYSVLALRNEKVNYATDYSLPENIAAPVKKGDRVGTLSVIKDNTVLKEIGLLAACDVPVKSYGDSLGDILGNW